MMSDSRKATSSMSPELEELCELVKSFRSARRRKLVTLCDKVSDMWERQKRLVQAAQEAWDQLHLDFKYLQFDLEVTRRERDALRAQIKGER
jgi:hypothetical protein